MMYFVDDLIEGSRKREVYGHVTEATMVRKIDFRVP